MPLEDLSLEGLGLLRLLLVPLEEPEEELAEAEAGWEGGVGIVENPAACCMCLGSVCGSPGGAPGSCGELRAGGAERPPAGGLAALAMAAETEAAVAEGEEVEEGDEADGECLAEARYGGCGCDLWD